MQWFQVQRGFRNALDKANVVMFYGDMAAARRLAWYVAQAEGTSSIMVWAPQSVNPDWLKFNPGFGWQSVETWSRGQAYPG